MDQFKIGQTLKIIKGTRRGKECVIMYKMKKMLRVKLLHEERKWIDRFEFDQNDRVRATRPTFIHFNVKTSSVEIIPNRKLIKVELNNWQNETSDLLEKYYGWTRTRLNQTL
jgi:hypothetical protein